MTFTSNRNVVFAASVVAAMYVGQFANTASAQDAETVDSVAIEANVASFTAQTSVQLFDRLSEPSFDLSSKLAELDARSTIKPDYAAYRQEDGGTEEPVVVASSR